MNDDQIKQVLADQQIICFHEAGHAVVAHLFGLKIQHIDVHSLYEEHATPCVVYSEVNCTPEERIMVTMAGTIAEGLCDYSNTHRGMGKSDALQIERISQDYGIDDDKLLELRRKTMQRISSEDTARAILDLVMVLDVYQMHDEILDGETVHTLIRNALENSAERNKFFEEVTGNEL